MVWLFGLILSSVELIRLRTQLTVSILFQSIHLKLKLRLNSKNSVRLLILIFQRLSLTNGLEKCLIFKKKMLLTRLLMFQFSCEKLQLNQKTSNKQLIRMHLEENDMDYFKVTLILVCWRYLLKFPTGIKYQLLDLLLYHMLSYDYSNARISFVYYEKMSCWL